MLETDMNQQKLKMLIKFDKIKFLEDFYNYHSPSEEIHLDADIEQRDLLAICEKYYLNHIRKIKAQEKKHYWALNCMQQVLSTLLQKPKQTKQNKLRFNLYLWKVQTMRKRTQEAISEKDEVL